MFDTQASTQQLSPRSTHRSPPIALPPDAEQAAAYVLSFVQSGDLAFDRSAAIEGMNERIDELQASSADVMERELFAHAQILSALFLRFTAQSVAASSAEAKAVYMKTALACQTNKGKRFPTSRVNATRSGAYACDVYSARAYVARLLAAIEPMEQSSEVESVTEGRGNLAPTTSSR
jgi:hypothetical protein